MMMMMMMRRGAAVWGNLDDARVGRVWSWAEDACMPAWLHGWTGPFPDGADFAVRVEGASPKCGRSGNGPPRQNAQISKVPKSAGYAECEPPQSIRT